MALTAAAGSTDYPLIIAPAVTGAVGSETPDGAAIFLLPLPGAKLGYRNISKSRPSVQGASEYASGKRTIIFQGKVKVAAQGASKGTAQMGLITTFAYTYSLKPGAAKCYLFYKNTADGTYLPLSWNSAHTQINYIKGYFANIDIGLPAGKIYDPSITFREATLP